MKIKSEKIIEETLRLLDYSILETRLNELNERLITYSFWMNAYIEQVGTEEAERLPKFVWSLYEYLTFKKG